MKRLGQILAGLAALLVVLFLVLRVPDTDPDAMRAKYGAAPSQFLQMPDGRTVHLRDEGAKDAPAIILLHGSNADLHTWQPWGEALQNQYRVIRFDQIGHGLTGPAVDDDYRLASFVDDVGEVADALGLERFVLGGNSMGGWIAMGYALEHPERLNGLLLVDASGAPIQRESGGTPIGFRLAAIPGVRDVLKHLIPRSIFARSLAQSVSNQAIVTEAEVDRYWELARYPGNRDATRKRFATPRVPFSKDEVAMLDTPTLVMWGDEDALIPLAAGKWYHETLPRSRFVHYPDIGHMPQQEHAGQSASDVRAWLAQLESDASGQ